MKVKFMLYWTKLLCMQEIYLFIIIFIQDTHITNVFFSGVLHDTIINKIYLYKYIQLIISQRHNIKKRIINYI
jgi:hypothetical protein